MIEPKIRSVKFNVLMNMILTSSQMIFPLVTLPYVSRILSTYGTGAVAFAQSVLSYFSLAALLGMQTYGVKACAAVRDSPRELSRTVRELLTILLFSTTVVFLIYIFIIFTVQRFSENRSLFLLFSLGLWLSSFGVEWFYQAIEQYGYITVRNVIFKFIGLVLMFLFVNTKDDYYIYGIIVLFSGYGMNILNLLRLRAYIDFKISEKRRIKMHLKKMIWYLVASTSSGMYIQMDILCLGFLSSTHAVGLYQLVSKIKNVLVQAVNSVGNVMLPRMTYYMSNNSMHKISDLMAKNFNFVGVVFFLIYGVVLLCSDTIVLILGGKDFAKSAFPLIFAIPAVLFSAINIIWGNVLITESKEREWAIINFVGLVLSCVYALLLIPVLGVIGAALTNSLTELSVLIMRFIRTKKTIVFILPNVDFLKIVLAGVIPVVFISITKLFLYIHNPITNLIVYGSTYLFFYFVLLCCFKESFICDTIKSFMNTKIRCR